MSLSDSDSPLSSVPSSGDEQSEPETLTTQKPTTKKQQPRKSSTPPRKPRRKEPPHVATLSDAPELAFIVMFRSRFADAFKGVPNLGCQDIERGVVDSTPSEQVEVLLCRLVGLVLNRKKPVERGHHQRPLEEAVHAHVAQWPRSWDGKSPFSGGRHFSALDAAQRLSVLKALINWALTSSEAIRSLIAESYKSSRHEDDLNIPISVQPWGRDGDKRRYWLIEGRDDTPFRLYRESNPVLKTVSWVNVAGTIDEIRTVAQDLEDEDGSKHALALKEKILGAIPRFEEGETRRKKREYRQSRKAFFKQPNGTSLYEGRTRGKRIKYTFSSEDEDTPNAKNGSEAEERRSLRSSPQPRFTASGRQIRKPVTGAYGELKINGSNGTATGEVTPYAGSESGNAADIYGGDGAEDWKNGSDSGSYTDDDIQGRWPSPEEEEEGAPKKSLRIILRVNKARLPESPVMENVGKGEEQEANTNGYMESTAKGVTVNGVRKPEQRTEIDVLPDAPEAVAQPVTTNATINGVQIQANPRPQAAPCAEKFDPEQSTEATGILTSAHDPNADIIIPLTKAEKDEKRRMELRDELKEGKPKMSSKKQKRLNKYIENKLKKEERVDLMQKLSETQVDTTLFRSTKTMGAAKESKREQMRRALLEEKFGINMEENSRILYEERNVRDVEEIEPTELFKPAPKVEDSRTTAPEVVKPTAVGSGLKRPLESDENGQPIIKKVKKSRDARKERLMAMIKAMELEEVRKAQIEGGSSMDEGSEEDDEEIEDQSESHTEDYDDDEEEWKGIPDSPTGEGVQLDIGMDITTIDTDGEGGDESSEDDDEGPDDYTEDSSEGNEGEEDTESIPRLKRGRSEKANAFKSWALAQVKQIQHENDPTGADTSMPDLLASKPKVVHVHVPRLREQDITPPPELQGPSVERKAYYITVDRPTDIQQARLGLPVVAEEQKIMEAIHNNPCVVICGETGSGKTTQVPQFLYEAGYGSPGSTTPGLIGVTQPRRVAAVSMASRVGVELGSGGKDKVAYQIRFEGTVGKDTAIKFMTDGVLLRELAEDFLLRKYSVVVIDEAHERSVNTDILIGVMSRVLKLRDEMSRKDKITKPLKLIIMSATLRVSDFTENKQLFPTPPPLLKAEARQHPVTVHFSRRTPHDYVEETLKKVCKIHRRLPPGGILVFLTGQNEITSVLRRLKTTFPFKGVKKSGKGGQEKGEPIVRISAREAAIEAEDVDFGGLSKPESDDSDEDSILDESDLGEEMAEIDTEAPLYVLPLYSLLPTKDQLKVFEGAPDGSRMCVLATNVAETSLTIPGIRYVVDCGRSKERNFDKVTGVQSFDIGWISKASAMQRAGRSGRTGPGHCYKLYSSAVYERDFEEFAEAEILRMPIDGVVLQMKSMNIDTITNFPFPTAPDRPSLQKAEKLLGFLGALDSKGGLTELGRTMNVFPLSPRFSKILIIGQQHECLPYIIAIVAALTVGEIFIPKHQLDINEPEETEHWPLDNETMIERTQRANRRKAYYKAHRNFSYLDSTCDTLKLLSVVCAYEYEKSPVEFCERNFVRLKGMQETHKLRQQITNIVRANCPGVIDSFSRKISPPSALQIQAIKQIVAAGFIDQVAIRADLVPNSTFKLGQSSLKKATDIPYITLFASSAAHQSGPETNLADVAVYIHPNSILTSQSSYPEYLVYSELKKSMSATGKVRMRPLTPVTGSQLAALAKGTPLVTYSKPLDHVPPKALSSGSRRECWVIPRIGGAIGKSELGWPLPAKKVVQKKVGGKWVIE